MLWLLIQLIESFMTWHKRLGHMSKQGLKVLIDLNLLPGLKSTNLDFFEDFFIW